MSRKMVRRGLVRELKALGVPFKERVKLAQKLAKNDVEVLSHSGPWTFRSLGYVAEDLPYCECCGPNAFTVDLKFGQLTVERWGSYENNFEPW